jgi:hypothetical protein
MGGLGPSRVRRVMVDKVSVGTSETLDEASGLRRRLTTFWIPVNRLASDRRPRLSSTVAES